MTFCPDCDSEIDGDQAAFVQHREQEHPPAPIVLSGVGAIQSETRFGTDPEEGEDNS